MNQKHMDKIFFKTHMGLKKIKLLRAKYIWKFIETQPVGK